MIDETGSINVSNLAGYPHIVRTSGTIQKVKNRITGKRRVAARKLSRELKISRTSIQRILKEDLALFPYKKILQPFLTDAHKAKRKKFSNCVRSHFRKEQTMKILFSDEKLFDIDGVYNVQNDHVWASSRLVANENGGVHEKRKFLQKVMAWLDACSKGITPLVIFEQGTVAHDRYIK